MPRVLPSSGFSAVQISRFMAYSRLLRASRRAVSPCERYRAEATLLGASCRRALEDRLAAYQSGRVIGSDVRADFSNRLRELSSFNPEPSRRYSGQEWL